MDRLERGLLSLGLKYLVPMILGQSDSEMKTAYRTLSQKDIALMNVRKKDGSVTVILGSRETGCTELAYRWAEVLNRRTYAVSPEQRPPSWMEWITLAELDEKVEPWSTVIFDDLPAYASNRDYNNQLVRELERLVPLCRHEKKIHMIFRSQSAAQADKYILDCDLALFKPLGLLMEDVERPNIRRIFKTEVNPYFEGRSEFWMKRHAWMRSRTYVGGISITKVPRTKILEAEIKDGKAEVIQPEIVEEVEGPIPPIS